MNRIRLLDRKCFKRLDVAIDYQAINTLILAINNDNRKSFIFNCQFKSQEVKNFNTSNGIYRKKILCVPSRNFYLLLLGGKTVLVYRCNSCSSFASVEPSNNKKYPIKFRNEVGHPQLLLNIWNGLESNPGKSCFVKREVVVEKGQSSHKMN